GSLDRRVLDRLTSMEHQRPLKRAQTEQQQHGGSDRELDRARTELTVRAGAALAHLPPPPCRISTSTCFSADRRALCPGLPGPTCDRPSTARRPALGADSRPLRKVADSSL